MEHHLAGDIDPRGALFVAERAEFERLAERIGVDAVAPFALVEVGRGVRDLVRLDEVQRGERRACIGRGFEELSEQLAIKPDGAAHGDLHAVERLLFGGVEMVGAAALGLEPLIDGFVESGIRGESLWPDAGVHFILAESIDHRADFADVVIQPPGFARGDGAGVGGVHVRRLQCGEIIPPAKAGAVCGFEVLPPGLRGLRALAGGGGDGLSVGSENHGWSSCTWKPTRRPSFTGGAAKGPV